MSAARTRGIRRASALVPLAVVSVAWTVSVAGIGGVTPTAATTKVEQPQVLPDGTALPTEAIEAPASVTADQGSLANPGNATQILSTASTSGIPSAALAAYQRAETVINSADTTCKLPWQLVAAIGRVESNHGRFGGSVLDDKGIATPGIYGPALDGTAATTLISDTDGGSLDNDAVYDRAVGPMQFIPSTWSVVGVDADGDGVRDPQDINDAALASAVYLCSGDDDLSTPAGQQASVYRYNHSQSYVDLVLSVMQAYLAGDFTTIPNSAVAAGVLAPAPFTGSSPDSRDKLKDPGKGSKKKKSSTPSSPTAVASPTAAPASAAPADKGDDDKSGGNGSSNGGTSNGGGQAPVKVPSSSDKPSLPALPSTSVAPVDALLTQTQAVIQCTLDGYVDNPLDANDPFDQCLVDYTTKPKP